MIFYFSGTGNSEWVANKLAKATNDTVLDIATLDSKKNFSFNKGDAIGLVFPIYAWRAPEIVSNFVKRIENRGAYTYAICTVGNDAGRGLNYLSKSFPLNAGFSIQMPNNYLPLGDTDGAEIERDKIKKAIPKIEDIAVKINDKAEVFDIHYGYIPRTFTYIVAPVWSKFMRSTKPFFVTDKCNSCGLCANKCPAQTIAMLEGKPVWTESTCYQCMKCIHRCPTRALQYGKGTITKGRYFMKEELL